MIRVLKFGGTSLSDHKRIIAAAEIVMRNDSCLVVCSAMSGMTNELLRLASMWKAGDISQALDILGKIEHRFMLESELLFHGSHYSACNDDELIALFENARFALSKTHTIHGENALLALGELATSRIFNTYINSSGRNSILLNALEFIHVDSDYEPDIIDIDIRLTDRLNGRNIYVTQGFIATGHDNNITNLRRGGSDYTATLIAAAINSPEVEICLH